MQVNTVAAQLAPAKVVIETIKKLFPSWPNYESQNEVAAQLSISHFKQFPAPQKSWRFLFKMIEQDVLSYNERLDVIKENEEFVVSDDLMELIVEAHAAGILDNESGYISFQSISNPSQFIPIKVIQSHNQVGTKVWGAGVYLGEILQREPTLLQGKCVLELGAGVGITGLLIARALPPLQRPSKVIMTDFHHEVVDLLAYNIEINNNYHANSTEDSACIIEADILDWSTVENDDFIRYNSRILLAADCTYSESGNVNLVYAFKIFLHTMMKPNNMKLNPDNTLPTTNNNYCKFLVENEVAFVLIACTIRNPATYAHFRGLIDGDEELLVEDVTAWGAAIFPVQPQLQLQEQQVEQQRQGQASYYYQEDRANIDLICIHLKC